MSTQPTLSPLEQLGQDVANPQAQPSQQQTNTSTQSQSPLELLGQDVQKPQASQSEPSNATFVVPSIAGHVPGVMDFGNKITPSHAAEGVAAGAVVGAAPFALSALPGVGEALLSHAEEQAGAWAAKYPHLVSLGAKLGIPGATTALLGWMIHSANKSGSGK